MSAPRLRAFAAAHDVLQPYSRSNSKVYVHDNGPRHRWPLARYEAGVITLVGDVGFRSDVVAAPTWKELEKALRLIPQKRRRQEVSAWRAAAYDALVAGVPPDQVAAHAKQLELWILNGSPED